VWYQHRPGTIDTTRSCDSQQVHSDRTEGRETLC
jgi:hypothetical protein